MAGQTPRRAFVTGASGFLGAALADRLRRDGVEVCGVDLRGDPGGATAAGDVSAPGPWQALAAGCDLVVHAAARVSLAGDLDAFWRANVRSTRLALDAAVRGGATRFVFVSSVTAFGFEFPDGVDERWPVRPDPSPYVTSKIAGEQVTLQAHAAGEIACTVVRPGDVYGPRSRPWTLTPLRELRARRLALPEGVMSPVYVDDLVAGVVAAARAPAAAGQVLTLTAGVGVANRAFFGHYARMLGAPAPPTVPRALLRAGAALVARFDRVRGAESEYNPLSVDYLSRRGTYSIERARALVGYAPRVDLDEGMRRTERWLRAEGLL